MDEAFIRLTSELGRPFSEVLGIDLEELDSHEVFKWFLASLLFGARISEQLATRSYREFEKNSITTPEKIIEVGWGGLVEILDAGGYARYDFKTATKLLGISKSLINEYASDLNKLHASCSSPDDLEKKLRDLGKGIGPVTVNIFLREMRPYWEKADPAPSELAVLAGASLGIISSTYSAKDDLKRFSLRNNFDLKTQVRLETALVRIGKRYCRRSKHEACPARELCKAASA